MGAPRRIRNPLGFETNLRRQDPTFSALVTRTQGPNLRVMRATYDTRGHVLTTTDSGTIVNGQVAVTRYGWSRPASLTDTVACGIVVPRST